MILKKSLTLLKSLSSTITVPQVATKNSLLIKMDKLTVIPPNEWPKLRDLFQSGWPHNLLGYYTVENFIRWHKKRPSVGVTLYSLNDDWRTSGAFVTNICKTLFFHCLDSGMESLRKLLLMMDFAKVEVLYLILARFKPILDELERVKGLKFIYKSEANFFHIPKDKLSEIFMVLEPAEGITLQPITKLEHLELADREWPFHYSGSLELFKMMSEFNLSVGAFDSNGDLLCWVFQYPNGSQTALQTLDKARRKGYGINVISTLIDKLSKELDHDFYTTVNPKNKASLGMAEKYGLEGVTMLEERAFRIVIDKKGEPRNKL